MTLSNGVHFLSIPGPSTVPSRVLRAMHQQSANIYEGPLVELTDTVLRDLSAISGDPSARSFLYVCNGHGAWEAAVSNLFSKGDKALVLNSGKFAEGWGEMARALGVEVEVIDAPMGAAVDPNAVEDRLRRDPAGEFKAVLIAHVDTASGVINDLPAIRAAIDAAGHPALYLVDSIASLGCAPFHMERWRIDLVVSAAQKGLMTPPGTAYNTVGPKALEAHKSAGLRTAYWDWTARMGDMFYLNFCGTAPSQQLFGLREAMNMLLEEGLEAAWARHVALSSAVHAAVERWAEGGAIKLLVDDPAARAPSVTAILTPGFAPEALRRYSEDTLGVTLGISIFGPQPAAFRIGHMGHVNAPMVLGTLGAVETGLKALGVPHGEGLGAAAAALAQAAPVG